MYDEIDGDEICDEREPDDEDDNDVVAAPGPRLKPLRFMLDRDGRHVETYVICTGCSVRTDSSEKLDDHEAAKNAYDRIRQRLLAEGYIEN